MMESFKAIIEPLLGLHAPANGLTLLQMCTRGFLVFAWGVLLVRSGDRRLLGRNAGFDMLLVVVLGSVLSRAVNGQAPFFPTLGVSGFLVALHHLLSMATAKSDWFSRLLKGNAVVVVRNGKIDRQVMARLQLTPDDLDENLRLNGNIHDVSKVHEARLERNGAVSVVGKT